MASEPQAAAIQEIRDWLATQQIQDPPKGSHASRIAVLLAAYDALASDLARLNDFCWHIDSPCDCSNPPDPEQAYRAMRAARDFERDRAVAAEAAIERVRALHPAMGEEAECWTCANEDGPLPWPCPTVRALDRGSAEPALRTREVAAGATTTALPPADPASPRDPLNVLTVDQLCSLGDDEEITVEGTIIRGEPRLNRARVPYITLTLADLDDPEITAQVDIHAPVYEQIGFRLVEGARVMIRGLSRQRTSLSAHQVRDLADWDGDTDPAVYAPSPPPPFVPLAASQFRAGVEQTRRDLDNADPAPVLDPSRPGFSPVHYVMALAEQAAAERDREDGAL